MSNSALLRAKILALVSAKIIALPESQKWQLITTANSSPRDTKWTHSRSTHTYPALIIKIALPALETTLVLFCVCLKREQVLFIYKD